MKPKQHQQLTPGKKSGLEGQPNCTSYQAHALFNQIDVLMQKREQDRLLRSTHCYERASADQVLTAGSELLNFSSNDYLGLASDFDLTDFSDQHRNESVKSGSMASPLVTGTQVCHRELQHALLEAVGANGTEDEFDCLLFSSGFAANQAFINAFAAAFSDAHIYQDKLNHASLIKAGVDVSLANKGIVHKRFRHNDSSHLVELIGKAQLRNKVNVEVDSSGKTNAKVTSSTANTTNTDNPIPSVIITEGVFSMDGDTAPIADLVEIKKQACGLLFIDDAHGFGCFDLTQSSQPSLSASTSKSVNYEMTDSPNLVGNSLTAQNVNFQDVDAYLIAFGKALGSQGAALILKKPLKRLIENFAKEFIYSTALSPLQTRATLFNLNKLQSENQRQQLLQSNISEFKKLVDIAVEKDQLPEHTKPHSSTAIQPILIGSEEQTLLMSKKLREKGFCVAAMRTPTVSKGQARLRVTITSEHKASDIKLLVECLCVSFEEARNECDS